MKWIEEHPVAWRVTLLILCFLITGYFEAQDEELFRQVNSMHMDQYDDHRPHHDPRFQPRRTV